MKTVSVEEFRAHVDQYLVAAAEEGVLLTQAGQPYVFLRPVANGVDPATDALTQSPEFWQMIRQRRQEQGIPWEEAKKQLNLEEVP